MQWTTWHEVVKIFMCGVVRLDLNEDYDRLHELVNHHDTIREMPGHVALMKGRTTIKRSKITSD